MKYLNMQIKILVEKRNNLISEFQRLPKGYLVLEGNYFSVKEGGNKVSLFKSGNSVQDYCRKVFILDEIKEVDTNLNILVNMKKKLKKTSVKDRIQKYSRAYQNQPLHFFTDHSATTKWMSDEFLQSDAFKNKLIYKTEKGDEVRTLSERDISNKIFSDDRFVYRYEPMLILDNYPYYPDFEVMLRETGKKVVYEHAGAENIDGYDENFSNKLRRYNRNGYKLGENLLVTFSDDIRNLNDIIKKLEEILIDE